MVLPSRPLLKEPRWYQNEAFEAVIEYFERGMDGAVVDLPTGAGKSLLIAMLARYVHDAWGSHVVILTHNADLIEQNAAELLELWPDADVGVYCAKIGRKEIRRITFASIDSVRDKGWIFGDDVGMVLIDEAHRVSADPTTRYPRLLGDLRRANPRMRLCGLTATPYRVDQGMITTGRNRVFRSIVYRADIVRLIDEGHLARVVVEKGSHSIDTSKLKIIGGEFIAREAEIASNVAEVNDSVLGFLKRGYANGRTSGLGFFAGVDHARDFCMIAQQHGIRAELITGETEQDDRRRIYKRFEARQVDLMCSVDVLSTGFNTRVADMLVNVQPIASTSKLHQIIGRLMRTDPNGIKKDGLFGDWGGCIERCGTITDPIIKKRYNEDAGMTPIKLCKQCYAENAISAAQCKCCGLVFVSAEDADQESADYKLRRGTLKSAATHDVIGVAPPPDRKQFVVINRTFASHMPKQKKAKADAEAKTASGQAPKKQEPIRETLRVQYFGYEVGDETRNIRQVATEIVCFSHLIGSFPHRKALEWWGRNAVAGRPIPPTTQAARKACFAGETKTPTMITVERKRGSDYVDIVEIAFAEDSPRAKAITASMFE